MVSADVNQSHLEGFACVKVSTVSQLEYCNDGRYNTRFLLKPVLENAFVTYDRDPLL